MTKESTTPQLMIVHDGGSLAAFEKKGNLTHYVEVLYNPGDFFHGAHILAFDKVDLEVRLKNPTLRVHYLPHLTFGRDISRLGRYIGRGLSFPFMLYQAVRIARRERISVIRSRNAYLAGSLAVLTGKITGIPVVVSLGGDNRIAQRLLGRYYLYNRYLSYRIEEFSLRLADRVFCTNEFTRQYAIRLGVRPERTRVVPHRVDVNLIGATEARARDDARPMVLFIGRFEPDKQVDVLVEAVPRVLERQPHARFVFIGNGSMRAALEQRCQALGITPSVVFTGYQTRDQIAVHLAAASVVWIPMSGFVIYEAAAAQRAIVAFDVEWHSEFIEDGVTGLLVKDRDAGAAADAVVRLLGNPDQAAILAANAARRFREECDPDRLVAREIQEYLSVMGDVPARPATDH
jgi:glycosyltransferase involved in cell wall biosynthesis